jgi:hypothetical protein
MCFGEQYTYFKPTKLDYFFAPEIDYRGMLAGKKDL